MAARDKLAVRRVAAALAAAGSPSEIIELSASARTAAEAAAALGTALGAIVTSLVFVVGETPVLVLVSGDRRCRTDAVAAILGREEPAARADARTVKAATGYSIGGVAPVGAHRADLPVIIDAALGRFAVVYAAAGHPYCVFATTLDELVRLTGGQVRESIAA